MASTKVSPRDTTGRERARLQKEHEEELAKREAEIATAVERERVANDTEVTDITAGPELAVTVEDSTPIDEDVAPDQDTVVCRFNEDLENVTIGHGNNHTFEAGRKYRVLRHVYDHLNEKGFVWH